MPVEHLNFGVIEPPIRSCDELLALVARGDKPAFDEMYRNEITAVQGLAFRLLRNKSHADEVAQEVMLHIWQNANQFDAARGRGRTWILQVTRGRSIDRIRSAQRTRVRDQKFHDLIAAGGVDVHDIEREVLDKLDSGRVAAALLQLSAVQREAVVLGYLSSSAYKDVAAELQVPVQTLKTRIRDGLIKLRLLLAEPQEQQAA